MADEISTANHGPPRGYSGMNDHLKKYLRTHPKHKARQQVIDRSYKRERKQAMKNQDGNKHTEMTAATLKRLAKGIRESGRETGLPVLVQYSQKLAKKFDAEAAKLRAMR